MATNAHGRKRGGCTRATGSVGRSGHGGIGGSGVRGPCLDLAPCAERGLGCGLSLRPLMVPEPSLLRSRLQREGTFERRAPSHPNTGVRVQTPRGVVPSRPRTVSPSLAPPPHTGQGSCSPLPPEPAVGSGNASSAQGHSDSHARGQGEGRPPCQATHPASDSLGLSTKYTHSFFLIFCGTHELRFSC